MYEKKLARYLIFVCLIFTAFSLTIALTIAQASVGPKGKTYSTGFTNPLPFPIPAGTSISVSISSSVSGSATITAPNGNVVGTIGMPGGSIILNEVGNYKVSESYHLEVVGNAGIGEPVTITDDASDSGSFTNPTPGSICTFAASSYVSLSAGEHSDNISISVSSGGASATLTQDLPPGGSASASVNITWGVNSSISVSNPPKTGTITVNTNLTAASFSLSGPVSYSGSGTSWSTTSAPEGQYTINYNDVLGYQKPPSETKTLTAGGTITFSGTYTPLAVGTIVVTTNLDTASFNISGTASYSGSGSSWSATIAPAGQYTISYNDVPGYQSPLSETKTLTAGGIITFSGIYVETPRVGAIVVNTNLDAARFDLSGPASYSGIGRAWSVTNTPVGQYTISYNDVTGYQKPPSEAKVLTPGGIVTFSGTYTPLAQVGTIIVNTNLTAASFGVSGPASYSGNGTAWSVTNAPVGQYTISYNDVSGYQKPSSETKILTLGGTITFTGTYVAVPQVGTIVVNANLNAASFSLSGPASYSGNGTAWSVTNAPVGQYTISYNDVSGYQKPSSEIKILTLGGTITFTGTYTSLAQVGTIVVNTNLDAASFSVSGPVNYSGSGRSWSKIDVPVGQYTITYNPVPGYQMPASETKTLTLGGTITFTGTYVEAPQVGTIVVNTNLDAASFSLSGPKNLSGSGKSQTLKDMLLGTYTIIYNPVAGYRTPQQDTKMLRIPGETMIFTGVYAPIPPAIASVQVSGSPAKAGDNIVVSMRGDAGNTATFSITNIVSDIPMTENMSERGTYTGKYVVPEGVNAVNVILSVRLVGAGGIASTNNEKTVTIDAVPPVIKSVLIFGSPAKKVGDIITIKLISEPGGVAKFSIFGITQDILMQEDKGLPGVYAGYYTAVRGLNVRSAKVIAHLKDAIGNASDDESQAVAILTAPWDVNSDGVVNILDIKAIGANLGINPSAELDINEDGVIDILDLALVGMHYGETYGQR